MIAALFMKCFALTHAEKSGVGTHRSLLWSLSDRLQLDTKDRRLLTEPANSWRIDDDGAVSAKLLLNFPAFPKTRLQAATEPASVIDLQPKLDLTRIIRLVEIPTK